MQVKNLKNPIILLRNIWYTDHNSDQTEELCVKQFQQKSVAWTPFLLY